MDLVKGVWLFLELWSKRCFHGVRIWLRDIVLIISRLIWLTVFICIIECLFADKGFWSGGHFFHIGLFVRFLVNIVMILGIILICLLIRILVLLFFSKRFITIDVIFYFEYFSIVFSLLWCLCILVDLLFRNDRILVPYGKFVRFLSKEGKGLLGSLEF